MPTLSSLDASRRQAAAARFARASQMRHDDEAATAAPHLDDLYNYDAFLGEQEAQPAVKNVQATTMSLGDAAYSASVPPVSHAAASGEFGVPIPPRDARAANRRLFYMRRHLTRQTSVASSSAAAAAAAGFGLVASAPAAALPGDREDYFDDDQMERRRPALFHDYIGRFRQQTRSELDDAEEDAVDRARRRPGRREDDDDEEEDERKMSDADADASERKSNPRAQDHNRSSHLPNTLSELLLTNYDRAQMQQERSRPPRTQAPVPVPDSAPRTSSKPPSRRPPASADSMLSSDESELDDDDDVVDVAARRSVMEFAPDDGRTLDVDGTDLREKGPTASAEAAEWARELVDDDMDRRRRHTRGRAEEDGQGEADEPDEPDQSDEHPTNPDGNDDLPDATAVDLDSPSSLSLRADFLRIMQDLFLDGFDGAFVEYARIDADVDNEDLQERERTEQEAYFEHDDDDEPDEREETDASSEMGTGRVRMEE